LARRSIILEDNLSFIEPQKGKSVGHLEMFPGGKRGLMQGGPAAGEGMEQAAPAPTGGR
jgi:hypothetical protein